MKANIRDKRLLSTSEVAKILGYCDEYVRQLIRKGRLTIAGKGDGRTGQYRIHEKDVESYIKSLNE